MYRTRLSIYSKVDLSITDLTGTTLVKGEDIRVVGFAHRRGYLIVDLGSTTMQVPNQLTDVKVSLCFEINVLGWYSLTFLFLKFSKNFVESWEIF